MFESAFSIALKWAKDNYSVLGSLDNPNLLVLQASNGITLREGHTDEDGDTGTDPHVWLNPQNAKIKMKNITDVLCYASPDNAAYFQQNYEKWAAECDRLDADFAETLSALPNKDNSIRCHNKLTRKAAGVLPSFTLDICRTDTTQVLAKTRFVCMVSAELPPTIIMISPSSTT